METRSGEILLSRVALLAVAFLVLSPALATSPAQERLPATASESPSAKPTAGEILRLSLSHWRRELDAARDYVFQERDVTQQLNKDGSVKKTEIRTYDVFQIYGDPYQKLVAKDDKPLNDKDRQKEEEKLNKFYEKRKGMSDEEREHQRTKERDKFQREIADEMPKMLRFTLAGEDQLEGHPVWVLDAAPNPDYHPTSTAGRLLSKVSGRVWITKDDYQWVKVQCDLSDDFSVGWFLFKLRKGTHFEFEQTRINNEIWLPRREFIKGNARVAIKGESFQQQSEYSNYRKFKSDSRIVGIAEAPTSANKASSAGHPSKSPQ